MACPTCDHTMHRIAEAPAQFWCPRCGTLKSNGMELASVPKLVERCQHFEATLGESWGGLWYKMGIRESINLPANRNSA